jgi:hypothetical protein
MDEFMEMLETREDQICGDIFDMLVSFADFETFKEMMLAFKMEHCSPSSPMAASGGLSLIGFGGEVVLHKDEVEDGDERPDLNNSLSISSPLGPQSPFSPA